MSKVVDCQKQLIAKSVEKGFLTFDDIMDLSDTYSLSVSEVDQLSEALEIRGIIIYETAPLGKDTDCFEDYSRIDYDAIFSEIISLSPELEYIVDLIRKLPPPQYGEISTLTAQVAAGNTFARERLILIHLRVALKIALSMAKSHQYDIADAVSAGFVGLVIAVDRFDPDGFSAFQSYASLWIQQNINRECYTNLTEETALQVAERTPFEAKWHLLAQVEVRCYILISNVSGAVKVAPLQILQFPVILPHKFQDAEKFNLQFSDFSEITETADKLRWLRYQKGLRQRDVADYAGIDRSTYVHYEEYGKDLYPPEHMEKIAQLFEVPVDMLLDDYNLFLRNGQGNQIKAIRTKLGLTQRQYADKLGVSLGNLKHWEQNRKQIFKSTWEKYFKQT